MKTGILRNVVRLLKYYLFFNRNRVLITVLIPFNKPGFFIIVAYAVIIFRVSEKIATIGTRFRFKISIHFYSFSYTIFYVFIYFLFLKNLYLSKQNRVPIKNNNTLLLFFSYTILDIFFKKSIFTQLEPGSDCSILPCSDLNVCSDVIGTGFRFIKIS